ncbi:hypothetical protein Zmor_003838 [Zophobas morio]|uniref:Uncharacterized protein n=1 Tax=Zophobas morio TaxID=2755281 RepID=A0AA38HMS9_9CUCU|nr:hypothetical protein Zmor_003838 [Zophobas morio]
MDIQANLYYHKSADRIIDYADFGGEDNRLEVANKALTSFFKCQGVSRKPPLKPSRKQPVAYYSCHNSCTPTQSDLLADIHSPPLPPPPPPSSKCLQEVLHAATTFGGLDVVATICDMGTNNVKALKAKGASIQTPYFTFGKNNIHTMYDLPQIFCFATS